MSFCENKTTRVVNLTSQAPFDQHPNHELWAHSVFPLSQSLCVSKTNKQTKRTA